MLIAAPYLPLVCLAPELLQQATRTQTYWGGRSLIVAVLVAMDALWRLRGGPDGTSARALPAGAP
jgi:preprotein translocase subunit SecY